MEMMREIKSGDDDKKRMEYESNQVNNHTDCNDNDTSDSGKDKSCIRLHNDNNKALKNDSNPFNWSISLK